MPRTSTPIGNKTEGPVCRRGRGDEDHQTDTSRSEDPGTEFTRITPMDSMERETTLFSSDERNEKQTDISQNPDEKLEGGEANENSDETLEGGVGETTSNLLGATESSMEWEDWIQETCFKIQKMRLVSYGRGSVLNSEESMVIDLPLDLRMKSGVRKEWLKDHMNVEQKLFDRRSMIGDMTILTPEDLGTGGKYIFVVYCRTTWEYNPDLLAYKKALQIAFQEARKLGITELVTTRMPKKKKQSITRENNAKWLEETLSAYDIRIA
jgi:hypothetical protein